MKWHKLGRIFCPDNIYPWMISHASVPFADYIENDIVKIYFSSRDNKSRSYTSWLLIDIKNPGKILKLADRPLLIPGRPGTFDDSGAMGSCLIDIDQKKFMYYIGWNLSTTVPFRNSIGLAISNDKGETYEKFSDGPIIDRNVVDNYFTASNCVLFDEGLFRMWYQSCIGWEFGEGNPKHKYHIKYAESNDGVSWNRSGTVAINFKNEYEYAISVPRVIRDIDLYRMWYSYRAGYKIPSYRIGYAESIDGMNWIRKDEKVGINVSHSGWDSEMIEYPYIFDHKDERYMLYNGNGYGRTGFGLAILEQD